MGKFIQGFYRPQNPEKVKGDVTNIIYRSSWELTLMRYLDTNPSVVQWVSEGVVVPYPNPLTGRTSRYFVDFKVKIRKSDGSIDTLLIEIKPHKETMPPDRSKGILKTGKPSKRYINEASTYVKNEAKWKAAEAYCQKYGWQFKIFTEYELGLKKKK